MSFSMGCDSLSQFNSSFQLNSLKYYLGILQTQNNIQEHTGKSKGKTMSTQAWTGPEGSRKLRLLDFKTIAT